MAGEHTRAKSDTDPVKRGRHIARKIAGRAGRESVTCGDLAAGLAGAIGPRKSVRILQEAGVNPSAAERFVKSIPDVGPEELVDLKAVKPDSDLAELLRGDLSSLLQGGTTADQALRILLGSGKLVKFKKDPFGALRAHNEITSGTELIRELTNLYLQRWELGQKFFSLDSKSGHSDFSKGRLHSAFRGALVALYDDQRSTSSRLLGSRIYQESPLGRMREGNEFGAYSSDIMSWCLASEVLNLIRPMTCRDVTLGISPKYLDVLGEVLQNVKALADAGLLDLFPPMELKAGSYVSPSYRALTDFLSYIASHEPLREEDTKELLARLP
jgi:hypothetical protein